MSCMFSAQTNPSGWILYTSRQAFQIPHVTQGANCPKPIPLFSLNQSPRAIYGGMGVSLASHSKSELERSTGEAVLQISAAFSTRSTKPEPASHVRWDGP